MAKDLIQTNTLQAGALGDVDRHRPMSPRYPQGCDAAQNCIPQGGVLTPAPGFGEMVDFKYRAQMMPPPDQKFYLRNGLAADQLAPDQASIPSDIVIYGKLETKLKDALAAGTYWAKKENDSGVGSYFDTAAYPFTGVSTAFWSTSDTNAYENDATIKYVRAVRYTSSSTGRVEWGVVCKKTTSKSNTNLQKVTTASDDAATLVLGRGRLTASATSIKEMTLKAVLGSKLGASAILARSELTATIKIEPVIYEAPKGWLKTPSANVVIVGKMEMFKGAPSITDYAHEVSQVLIPAAESPTTNVATASTSGSMPSVDGLEDVYVLAYGTQPSGVFPDDFVVGMDAAWSATFSAATVSGGKKYYFQTTRNIVMGPRRIGKARYYNSDDTTQANTPDDRNTGLAATGANATGVWAGDWNTPTTVATGPWFMVFDSPVQWYEPTYSGLVVGTVTSEYILSNEQIAPTASSSVGVSSRKISSIGTHLRTDDRVAISTQLNGSILFCSHRGIAQMTFSNERQQYLPQLFDTVSAGYGRPKSIASSKFYGIIFCLTEGGKIICLNPDTGGVTEMTQTVKKTSDEVEYFIKGLDTVDGEPRIVWERKTGAKTYKMSSFSGLTTSPMFVRTSRFGAYTGKNGIIRSAYLSLMGAVGGKVRVASGAYQTREFPWVEIPYTEDQIDAVDYQLLDGETRRTFTGTVRVDVMDSADNPSEGKAIELEFLPGEQASIVAVSVEMKEI